MTVESMTLPSAFTTPPREAEIFVLSGNSAISQVVLAAGQLLGVAVRSVTQSAQLPPNPAVVFVDPHHDFDFSPDFPVITVAQVPTKADLQLPRDLPLLAQTMVRASLPREVAGAATLFVAGWQGGVGVSGTSAKLAQIANALLLDASGNPPGKEVHAADFHWGKISAADPPLQAEMVSRLGRAGLRTGIVSRLPDVVDVEDPRVLALLGGSDYPAVVDAGVWRPELEKVLLGTLGSGRQVRLMLLGEASVDGCMRLINVLSAGSVLWHPQRLFAAGKVSEELAIIGEHWQIPTAPLPQLRRRSVRPWRRIWVDLWGDEHGD